MLFQNTPMFVNIQKLPSESYATAIATRVQGGNAPDVFQAESGSGQTNAIGNFASTAAGHPQHQHSTSSQTLRSATCM